MFKQLGVLLLGGVVASLSLTPAMAESETAWGAGDSKNSIYYYQRDGSGRTNIMRKYDDRDPERVYSLSGYPRDYRFSGDYRYMAFDYGDSVSYLDMRDKRLRDVYDPKYGMGGMAYSPDGSSLMVLDHSKNRRDFLLYNYDIKNNRGSYYGRGQLKSEFHLLSWRPDGKIIFMEERDGKKIIWSLDLATRKFTKSNYSNPDWLSGDGKYMSVPSSNYSSYGYNDYRDYGYGYGKSQIIDPVTNRYYGDFGSSNRYHYISDYDPGQNRIYYGEYDSQSRPYASGQYSYDPYAKRTNTVADLEDVNLAAATKVVNYGNFWVIFVDRDAIIKSDQQLGLIDEFPDYNWR